MKANEILMNHKLKRTSCREGIIETIMNSAQALSENQITENLKGNYDRTTFYRSFKTLQENKIIHKIVVDNQIVKYALNHTLTSKKQHAHFYCNNCQTVQCMESLPVKKIKLPDGFTGTETEFIIKGICASCNHKTH